MSRENPHSSKTSAMRLTAFGLAVVVLGLLLWARFLLVTGHPRTAIAKPEASAPQAATQAPAASEPGAPAQASVHAEQR